MANKLNQIVRVNTVKATSSVLTTSVNTVAIVVTGSAKAAGEYSDLDSVVEDFAKTTEAYKMAQTFFSQKTHPDKLVIITAASASSSDVIDAVESASGFDFFHVVLSYAFSGVDAAAKAAAAVAFVKALDTKANEVFKMFHLEVNIDGNASLLSTIFSGEGGLTESGTERVSIWAHDTTTYENEHLAVAIVAQRCGVDPARGTWAHKKGLVGITPDNLTASEVAAAKSAGYNIYTTIAGVARTFMGTTCGPTAFIDTIVKCDWIKFNTESEIYRLLGDANEGYGLTYDDTGIQAIGAIISKVLTQAADSTHQYIMEGYTVTVPTYASIAQAQKDKRNVPNIKGNYSVMDSVHTVLDVTLNIVYPEAE
ncbi:Protein of unknown function [Fibrobacter sp. UWOV1]|uniref:DUF3383 family protein n=1 Tax=Fibrobacter sp. UWOV1 TaxID=1896215 RepID=UPI00091FF9ED|nr:DUF3383 family protein [Fibrobacter sp. UWOV1]SHL42365.1 Protein of unknown function [Fibrobacter sp. UWOV1]